MGPLSKEILCEERLLKTDRVGPVERGKEGEGLPLIVYIR